MKTKQAEYYNHNAKELRKLRNGETVRVKSTHNKTWEKAQVEQEINIRSYRVRTEDGRQYRRNRKDLKATFDSFVPDVDGIAPPEASETQANEYQATKQSDSEDNKRSEQEPISEPLRRSTRIRKTPLNSRDYHYY